MRISCPYCGERDGSEFSYLGDARLTDRPDAAATTQTFHDYLYLRENPAGAHRELWRHASGCGSWLIVTRDTLSHAISDVRFGGPHA